MNCPKCNSENTVSHTDDELRKLHLLVWQCFDCDEYWQTGWDIHEAIRKDIE